ncbi:UDP-N-acetylglucosamine 2-epimerase [Rhodovulum adriaticum]|uniref:UDP-N-acetylglucosamine 2-epimerase (Hydrolysing) n=1 Tax=Rhodovulum adriaticum TaxID=35804 RepID=A0A4V2SMG8_RHOAD|nr:UDP-N-acetylglucosamine 2-epimerase [Rhodovulum adriaticum]MBK1634223.1 UDP-N-acetylglucosamine 2-epimerase (hydrolyzing) [Rhodovulum adriaticum]TCP27226.1 UDP-N-acetylglucosamine 2-epimerase (hydrolysing) [Rhodovulum adriaticum]
MSAARSILFVTGTRADFGKLEPLARAARDAGHRVAFFVTGMHMLPLYGLTKVEVHRMQGVEVVEFLNHREGDPQDVIFAKTVLGFSDHLRIAEPDLVVVHGDRVEAMATALVCATNYIRCAHVEGGEVSGTIDEVFRHCNTKLATCHLVSSQEAKARVLALGETDDRVYVIGSPELDTHRTGSGVALDEVRARYAIPFQDYGIVIFHPVTSEVDSIGQQAEALFDALAASGRHFVVIRPNNDPGSDAIQAVIAAQSADRFRELPSMRFSHFSELLRNASAIIGNSSTGVREAPFLGVPSLDIGTRQTNRANAVSVHHATAFDRVGIDAFLSDVWGRRFPASNAFGGGTAAENFLKVLEEPTVWTLPLQKTFNDVTPPGARANG